MKYLLIIGSLFYSSLICGQLNFSEVNQFQNAVLTALDSAVVAGSYERITSILIAKKGKVLFEKYYQENTIDSKHNTRSTTKTMATLLTGIAIEKGFIKSEKDKIFTYLKHKLPVKNPDKRKEEITIEDLLTMSSALECDDGNSFSRGNEERMYSIEDWTKFYLDLPIRSYPFGPKPAELPYGRSFSYCSAGAATMAEVLQSAVKSNIAEFAKKNLLDPLKTEDYILHYTPLDILNTAGGSEYKSRDLLKLGQLCLNNGMWNKQQILPKGWISKATTPKAVARGDVKYGYFFWLKSFGKEKKYKAFYMSGNGGQKVLVVSDLELAVVITTTNYNNRNAHHYTDEIMDRYIIPASTKMKD